MNKKGEVSDVMIFLITIFVLAVGLFILMFIVPSITGGLRTAGLNNTAAVATAIDNTESMSTGMINNGFLLLFTGLIISVFITSFMVRTHPIFLFLYIIFLGITILLGVYLGNAYYTMQHMAIFSSMTNSASFINIVMNHIVEIVLAVGALSMIIVFAKFSTGGNSQQF